MINAFIMKENLQSILNDSKPVLVDFFAEWCGPCKVQAPVLKEVKTDIGDSIRILKIDVDKSPAIAQQYQVSSIPTLILFRNGQPIWRQTGVASKQQLVNVIKQHI
jgi:thioredoxin 1